ncbi:MAG: transcriptional regulator [Gammaproteobacteria bacterium RBG_16_51_14]|nr:MAG: transcriptional regulator [Gammaproteobacteria bacterium RBG_16_51_14]
MKSGAGNENSFLEFPCDFPIKVMGKAGDAFDMLVMSIVRKHVPDVREGALRNRVSRRGNYIAVTITIEAQTQEQIDAIYHDLTAHERVIMAL